MGEFSSNERSVTADTSAQAGSFTTGDPCIHEQATAPWDVVVTPLSRGPYKHAITYLASPRMTVYRERFWCRTRIQGLSPPGMFGFAVPLKVSRDTRWWRTPLHETGLPAMMPGGMHVDFSEGHQHLVTLVDLGLLRDSLPEELMDAIEAACQQHVLSASRDAVARLSATLNALLDGTHAHPQVLHYSHAVSAMEQDLLTAFRQSLTLPTSAPRRMGRATRQGGLQRAIEYLRSTDAEWVTVADLCAVARVTERTLEYAFRENFGTSPTTFLHLRRYHASRTDLLAADPETATVSEIALNNGFYHLGRFAVRYKELFGESPSQTLGHAAEKGDRYLLRPENS